MSGVVSIFPLVALIAIFAFMFGKSNQKRVSDQEVIIHEFQKRLQSTFSKLSFSFHKNNFFDCNNIAIVKTSTGMPIVVVADTAYIKGLKSDPMQRVLTKEYSIQFDDFWFDFICEFIESNFEVVNRQ